MNKTGILKIAENIFDTVSPISKNTYKAEMLLGSKIPAGIFFLDFNQQLHQENFDEYQENLLADEYFKSKGNIQWNYYLLLFQDKFNLKKKQEIEQNDRYARKYIFTETEFKDFFKLEESKKEIDQSIVINWKKKLNEVGLQEVYSKSPVSRAIDRFYSDSSHKDQEFERYEISTDDVLSVRNINKVILTNKYRPFPEEIRNFDFGKVNLVKGTNGVGKTSLFEAIELILCGRNNRNPDHVEPNGIVKAIFNNTNKVEENQSSSNDIFRRRDAFWYSNNYTSKNYLPSAFNRYNFFNSDAAYGFANSSNEKQIKEALFNLVLGSEYNYINERTEKFYSYLKPEFNRLTKDFKDNNQIIKEEKGKIEILKAKSKVENIESSIRSSIDSIKIIGDINNIKEDHSELEVKVNSVKSIIEKINELENYPNSKKDLNSEIEAVEIKKKHLKNALEDNENLLLEIEDSNLKLKKLSKKLSVIKTCNKYFVDKRLFEIEGLSDRKEHINIKIQNILNAVEILNDVKADKLLVKEPIQDYLDAQQSKLKLLIEKKKNVDEKLGENLDKLNKIEKTVKEIKLLGQKYLTLNQNSAECPLCNSHFEPSELLTRIQSISKNENAYDSERTKKLHLDQTNLTNSINELNNIITDIQKVIRSYSILFPEGKAISDKSSTDIISQIEDEKSKLPKLRKIEEELGEIENLIRLHSVSESEFAALKNNLKQIPIATEFKFSNKNDFKNMETELGLEIAGTNSKIEILKDKRIELIRSLKRKIKIEIDDQYDLNTIKNDIQLEEREKQDLKNYFDQLAKFVRLDENDKIDEMEISLNTLLKNISTLKNEINNQFEINSSLKRVKKAEEFIKNNQNKFTRVKAAKSTLESLSGNEGNEEMKSFFAKNLDEIIDIFKTIHLPKEFVNISFKGGLLSLIDIKGKKRKISEISTGQRSALALSIFISLNRKLKYGPDIVIFDDPVSYIDDFNALSFLDFLRYFVLKEKKQIFFATASTKLANLFERKFSFLENDFQKWELKRDLIQ